MFKGFPERVEAVVSCVPGQLTQFFIRPLRLLASLDLWEQDFTFWWHENVVFEEGGSVMLGVV